MILKYLHLKMKSSILCSISSVGFFHRMQIMSPTLWGQGCTTDGTFISIKQEGDHCGHTWKWNSHPFFEDVPVGNILLSAAIILVGLPQPNHFASLSVYKWHVLKERTFHCHQMKARTIYHIQYSLDVTLYLLESCFLGIASHLITLV